MFTLSWPTFAVCFHLGWLNEDLKETYGSKPHFLGGAGGARVNHTSGGKIVVKGAVTSFFSNFYWRPSWVAARGGKFWYLPYYYHVYMHSFKTIMKATEKLKQLSGNFPGVGGIWTAFRPGEGVIWTKIVPKFKWGGCPGGGAGCWSFELTGTLNPPLL